MFDSGRFAIISWFNVVVESVAGSFEFILNRLLATSYFLTGVDWRKKPSVFVGFPLEDSCFFADFVGMNPRSKKGLV